MKLTEKDIQDLKETYPNIDEGVIELNSKKSQERYLNYDESPEAKAARQRIIEILTTKRRSKYNAIKTEYNDVVYHSKKEAAFAQKLDLMLKAGEIDYVLRQVPFTLDAGIVYRADFVTLKKISVTELWDITVYEVKGMKTKEWVMKEKLFRSKYPNLTLEII